MKSLSQDLSALTSIPKLTLEKLGDKAKLCIADNILETLLDKKSQVNIDIGIGNLYIKLEDETIKYKFIPAKDLDTLICDTLKSKQSPIIKAIDNALKLKIEATYKELL